MIDVDHPEESDPSFRRILIGGVAFDPVSTTQTVDVILQSLRNGCGGSVMTPNLDHLRQYQENPSVRHYFESADLVVADGMPLVWASRLQGTPLPGRVAGSDLALSLARAAGADRRRLFLLGGEQGAAERAAVVLTQNYPGIEIAGTHFPPHGFERDRAEIAKIASALKRASPDIVYVGLPFVKAERVIADVRPAVPEAWFLALGVTLSFIAGDLRRAPRWMQRLGLEWLFRLASEPQRLFHRYLIKGIPFCFILLAQAHAARSRPEPESS